jgi:hypothetical protein
MLRRKILQQSGALLTIGLAGCLGLSAVVAEKVGLIGPVVRSSASTISGNVAMTGQPTIEDGVPATWGAIANTPEEAQNLIDWNALINDPDGPVEGFPEFTEFDPENEFVTVIVGVLPYGEGITGLHESKSDAHFDGTTVRYEVTNYQAISSTSDGTQEPVSEDDDPAYHYDYSMTLWDRNGFSEPNTIEVNYHETNPTEE